MWQGESREDRRRKLETSSILHQLKLAARYEDFANWDDSACKAVAPVIQNLSHSIVANLEPSLTHHDREDRFQEAFQQVLNASDRVYDWENFVPFFCAIVRNRTLDDLRNKRCVKFESLDAPGANADDLTEPMAPEDAPTLLDLIDAALNNLAPDDQKWWRDYRNGGGVPGLMKIRNIKHHEAQTAYESVRDKIRLWIKRHR